MGNVIFSIVWLIILIFISFWIAGICAFLYIIIYPLTVCIDGLSSLTDVLLQGVQFPHLCAKNMMAGTGL